MLVTTETKLSPHTDLLEAYVRVQAAENTGLVLCKMSLGTSTSEALRELLTACLRADQVAALHTLGLHPGLINERWAGEMFHVAGVW